MEKDVALFVVAWIVSSILLCAIYNKIFPSRELTHKTKGYMCDMRFCRSHDNIRRDIHVNDCCKITYRFSIEGKEYRKTYEIFDTNPELEVDILYNKGYSDACPSNIGRIDRANGIYIKLLLCVFLAPVLSRMFVNFFNI